jgi:2-polyprenyl-3-methyl-5-hydroxy-6-metoxy-1,4-benzoquinol methylase
MSASQTTLQQSDASSGISPIGIFEILGRHQHTMALKGAIDLEVFTHVAAGASTAAEIGLRCKAPERSIRILCDYLTILGLLNKTGSQYGLSPEAAAFLDKASPAYCGTVAQFLASPARVEKFQDVAGLVRRGGAPQEAANFEKEGQQWVDFARFMMPMVVLAAKATAAFVAEPQRKQKVLDIAAGSGLFGVSIAELNPNAEITALDWPNVLEVAQETAQRSSVEGRFRTIGGSAFDVDLGSDYDVVLIPNFLHHFDTATNVEFLKKVRKALKPGGRVATVEFVPNDDRVTPAMAAAFSFVMLAFTPSGDAYTYRELTDMFVAAGFGESDRRDLLPTPLTLIITST